MRARGDFNAQMFNSFLDGTKSAIEMCAVANATGLTPAPDGLAFPPCGVDDLPKVLRPHADGGVLHQQRAGRGHLEPEPRRPPVYRDLRWGVYVVFAGGSEYVDAASRNMVCVTDPSGHYAAMYKPFHLIGLELGISVASVGLRGEATGVAIGLRGGCRRDREARPARRARCSTARADRVSTDASCRP